MCELQVSANMRREIAREIARGRLKGGSKSEICADGYKWFRHLTQIDLSVTDVTKLRLPLDLYTSAQNACKLFECDWLVNWWRTATELRLNLLLNWNWTCYWTGLPAKCKLPALQQNRCDSFQIERNLYPPTAITALNILVPDIGSWRFTDAQTGT